MLKELQPVCSFKEETWTQSPHLACGSAAPVWCDLSDLSVLPVASLTWQEAVGPQQQKVVIIHECVWERSEINRVWVSEWVQLCCSDVWRGEEEEEWMHLLLPHVSDSLKSLLKVTFSFHSRSFNVSVAAQTGNASMWVCDSTRCWSPDVNICPKLPGSTGIMDKQSGSASNHSAVQF